MHVEWAMLADSAQPTLDCRIHIVGEASNGRTGEYSRSCFRSCSSRPGSDSIHPSATAQGISGSSSGTPIELLADCLTREGLWPNFGGEVLGMQA